MVLAPQAAGTPPHGLCHGALFSAESGHPARTPQISPGVVTLRFRGTAWQ